MSDSKYRRRVTIPHAQPAREPSKDVSLTARLAVGSLLAGAWLLIFPQWLALTDLWFWIPTWTGAIGVTLGLLFIAFAGRPATRPAK